MSSTVDELASWIPRLDQSNPKVSNWTVGQQIYHCLVATTTIAKSVTGSDPGSEVPSFSLPRFVVMTLGWIPRGKGKAPKGSQPESQPTSEELQALVGPAKEALAAAAGAPADAFWRHFKFGVMPRDNALKFIEIHNRHHLRIIEDISKGA